VNEYVRQGLLTPIEAKSHPARNVISRAVGIARAVEAETIARTPAAGDLYLLCSDGLTNMVGQEEIQEILMSFGGKISLIAGELIERAKANGGKDNITVALVAYQDRIP